MDRSPVIGLRRHPESTGMLDGAGSVNTYNNPSNNFNASAHHNATCPTWIIQTRRQFAHATHAKLACFFCSTLPPLELLQFTVCSMNSYMHATICRALHKSPISKLVYYAVQKNVKLLQATRLTAFAASMKHAEETHDDCAQSAYTPQCSGVKPRSETNPKGL